VTYFTDGPIIRSRRDVTEFPSSLGEVAGAAAEQALTENPLAAGARMESLENEALGEPIVGEQRPDLIGINVPRRAPATPLLSVDEAKARVKDAGLPLSIDGEIREGALTLLMDRKREELKRQIIIASGPKGSVPVAIAAGFAASMVDPLNIASGFIPVVGEARFARMLERATSATGRFGVRAGVGAVEGATGAALLEPIVYSAAQQDQADYDMADSLLNVAFGGVLGAGLHSIGGAVSDWRRAKLLQAQDVAKSPEVTAGVLQPEKVSRGSFDTLEPDIRAVIEQQMQADVTFSARQRALEEVTPDIRTELEDIASGRTPVRELKVEQTGLQKQLDGLDDTFKGRAKTFQAEGLSRKQAEKAAREAIADDRQTLTERVTAIERTVEQNRQAEVAGGELAQLRRGEIPERFIGRIAEREQQIRQGVLPKPLAGAIRQSAREVAESSPFAIRQNALKTAIAQAMTGRAVDVEHVFNLARNPEQALQRAQTPQSRAVDADGEAASVRADDLLKTAKDDLADLEESVAFDEQTAREVAEQTGVDIKAELKQADELAADADTYTKAWRAAALCGLRH
jgi:hypothetical protein